MGKALVGDRIGGEFELALHGWGLNAHQSMATLLGASNCGLIEINHIALKELKFTS